MTRFFVFSHMLLFAAVSVGAPVETQRGAAFQYAEQWKAIDRLMEGILPQSALPEIEKVRQAALRDGEHGHLVKAVMRRSTCLQLSEAKPQVAVINSLLAEAEALPMPAKAAVYSLAGEAFMNFYNQNRWNLYGRTALAAGAESDDIETWDAARLLREIAHYYRLSLDEAVLLQKTPVGDFKEALDGDEATRHLRPTLYDLLAHRAIDAFMNNDLRINDFSTMRAAYFADAQEFVETEIVARDTLAPTFLILRLFQDLTAFRLERGDVNALADVSLKRFNYLRERGNLDDADALYEEAMKKLVASCVGQQIWGKAAHALATHYQRMGQERSGRDARQRGRYLIEAANLLREIEKSAPLNDDRKLATEMLHQMTLPEASLSVEKNLLPQRPSLALVTYKNLRIAYLNVYRCEPEELDSLYRTQNWRDVAPHFLSKLEKISSRTLSLPDIRDYQSHSFETKLDAMPLGNYLLVLSDKANPEKDRLEVLNFHTVQVTGIKLLQRQREEGIMEAYAVDALTGRPLQGAQITVMRRIYDREASSFRRLVGDSQQTDADGIAIFRNSHNDGGNKLRVTHGDDRLTENMFYYFARQVHQRNVVRTAFFTDRAIYRPGQTVYFKGLMYETYPEGQNAILTKAKTVVQLMDVNGREISRQEFVANEFGSFNGTFSLPHGLLNGQMRIMNGHGSVAIQVEEYKRPTFEIEMQPVTADYTLGDTVTLTGVVRALAGYPTDGARVTYNVVRRQQLRPLRWFFSPPQKSDLQVASGTMRTDASGRFSVSFPAMADDIAMSDENIYRFVLTADVTDVSGETRSETQSISLSRVPLIVDWKPKPVLSEEEGLEIPIRIANLNGGDAPADVRAEVWSLKSPDRLLRHRLWQQPDTSAMTRDEFVALFPNDPYLSENQPENFERNALAAAVELNTGKTASIDLSALRHAPAGWYQIVVRATGGQKNATVADSVFVQLRHRHSPVMHMNDWLTVVKASGEPGEAAVFRVAGGCDSSMVRYDVLFKNQVVERKWVTVGRVPQELRFPVTEERRGGFAVAFAMVHDNRQYVHLQDVDVPFTNKELDVEFTTFREQLLPGEKERWTLTVKNKQGEREAAEMAVTLYDASLDMFAKHGWNHRLFNSNWYGLYGWHGWNNHFIPLSSSRSLILRDRPFFGGYQQEYERLRQENWGGMMIRTRSASDVMMSAVANDAMVKEEEVMYMILDDSPAIAQRNGMVAERAIGGESDMGGTATSDRESAETARAHASIPLRANFSETAFFYPELRTNERGEIMIDFTIPEALTRWNMLGFAHTKDLKTGGAANSLITQKQVAISANMPRFFREGDTLVVSARVNNLTEQDLSGRALLRLFDAFTMQAIDSRMLRTGGTQTFDAKAGQSASVEWKLAIPPGLQAVTYRLTAQAGSHTDGEERSVPVLSNRMLVTETMPFMVRGDQRRDFRFNRLADNKSATLQHHRLTLEYTSNPAWYAVQALPYLMEYPFECSEQVFSRFYANALASSAANSSPRIKQVFEQWRAIPESRALLSNLEKNQELKQVLLEETPWVMQAASETERKKRVGLLFDLNRMANEQQTALNKLMAMQGGNGGFPWFAGMPEDRFITQHIVAGLEHLRRLNALPRTDEIRAMIERAIAYCDARISEDYKNEQSRDAARRVSAAEPRRPTPPADRDRPQITRTQLHYLYMCSFSKHYSPDQQAFDFYMQQAERSWSRFNVYEQAMIALTMHRYGKTDVAQAILRSLKERAQTSDELGMYWTDNRRGYFWHESPVETQAMLIEAFSEAGRDARAVSEMKIWLLRNKQTTDWKTTKATAAAVYALLSDDEELLAAGSPLDIRIAGKPLPNAKRQALRPEAGTGHATVSWEASEISGNLANLRVANPNSGIAWGAMYWQYYEQMDNIGSAETNLQMTRQLFVKRNDGKGAILEPVSADNQPAVGDLLTVRLELRADRDFEYVHLKDARASGFEPVNALSGYRFQGGLGYYENIKDASVNFFISYLPQGAYVFEYDLRVTNVGNFAAGATTFQCMYAPEFSAVSGGGRVRIVEN